MLLAVKNNLLMWQWSSGIHIKYQTIGIVDTDGLVLKHQAISSHSAETAPMHFQLFMA